VPQQGRKGGKKGFHKKGKGAANGATAKGSAAATQSPPAATVAPNPKLVAVVMECMACSDGSAKRACVGVANRSAEEAMEYYFAHESDPGFHDPFPEDSGGNNGEDNDEDGDDSDEHDANDTAAVGVASQRSKKKKAVRVRRTPLELQRLFAQLQLASVRSVSTEQLTTKAFAFKDGDASVQHDAQVTRLNITFFYLLALSRYACFIELTS